MQYSVNLVEQYRSAAGYVDRILRGADPDDLPVRQPTQFTLPLNVKTATAVDVPPALLAFANEVVNCGQLDDRHSVF
jgi:putative ABC transport system substrate-binding protein